MHNHIKNKIVVVTGAAEGIGFEIAEKFLANGAKLLLLLDINENKGVEAVKMLNSKHGDNKCVFIKCDVTKDLDSVADKIINEYKTIDIFVNNAGIADETNAKKTIEVNLLAMVEWSMKFWEHMKTDTGGKGGTIINVASIYGFRVNQFVPFYIAAKHGIMGFTKSLGHKHNFEQFGVRVLAICPGFTKTNLGGDSKHIRQYEKFLAMTSTYVFQEPAVVGECAMVIFETADSGTAWVVEHGQPIAQV